MKYKRLTFRHKSVVDGTEQIGYTERLAGCYRASDMILERLAELEDKIEQGTLIELPCKVGDTVYVLREDCFAEDNYKTKWHIAEGFIKKIYINTKNEIFLQIISWVSGRAWSKDSRNYKVKTYTKTVFLTREEAEKRLEEIQNG